jgi:hypothetical protein
MQAVRQRRTTAENSRGMSPPRAAIRHPDGVRAGLGAVGLAGVVALVAATPATVIQVIVGTTTRLASLDTELSGWDRHGPALLIVAALALVMLAGAVRGGARPASVAVAVCGAAALAIALVLDLPHLDDTGQVGRLYTDASAGPELGFWLETLGGALLLAAGAGLWFLSEREPRDLMGLASSTASPTSDSLVAGLGTTPSSAGRRAAAPG